MIGYLVKPVNTPGISLIPHLQCDKSVPWSETKFPLTETMDPMTGSPRLMLLAKFMGLGRRIYTLSVLHRAQIAALNET